MAKFFNRTAVAIATAGQGTVTFGAAITDSFLTPSEAGAVDTDTPYYLLTEGDDFEIGIGTVGGVVTTLSRDTVLVSKIAGVAGTTKLTLAGSAVLRFVGTAEGLAGFLALAGGTISGALTVQGAFTSLGIDDDASATALLLGNTTLALGDGSGPFTMRLRGSSAQSFKISGSSDALGGHFVFYGSSHATQANDIDFRSGAASKLLWDDSDSQWEVKAKVEFEGNILTGAFLDNYEEEAVALGSIGGGAQDIDASKPYTSGTVDTSTTTFTFINPPSSGNAGSFTLELTNGGSQTVNWPASVKWVGGTAPGLTAAGVDILTFVTRDGGTTWHGFPSGLAMA